MSGLLTEAEFESIAGSTDLPSNAFINGKFMAAKSGKTTPTINPATGKVITEIAACQSGTWTSRYRKLARRLIAASGRVCILLTESR